MSMRWDYQNSICKTFFIFHINANPDHSKGRSFTFFRTKALSLDEDSILISCLPFSRTDMSISSNLLPHEHRCLSLLFETILLAPHFGHLRTLLLPDHLPLFAKSFPSTSMISIE